MLKALFKILFMTTSSTERAALNRRFPSKDAEAQTAKGRHSVRRAAFRAEVVGLGAALLPTTGSHSRGEERIGSV